MNDNMKKYIMELALNQKSKDKFLRQAKIDASNVKKFAIRMLEECLESKNPDDVELALMVCTKFEFLKDDTFRVYIVSSWKRTGTTNTKIWS